MLFGSPKSRLTADWKEGWIRRSSAAAQHGPRFLESEHLTEDEESSSPPAADR